MLTGIMHLSKRVENRNQCNVLIRSIGLIMCFFAFGTCELIEMKIVDEPMSLGNVGNSYLGSANTETTLKLRMQPANFSGPPHFRRLIGRCFDNTISGYKYKFCPFHNVTQHEQGVNWNPYNGILGVWQEWEIRNNTFVAMIMKDGDDCGNIYRSVKVSFKCGSHSEILNASEPETCSYHLDFQTPLVCHPDSMLVYPTLSQDLKDRWDLLEGEMLRGELTEKGYKKRLDLIFESAGYLLNEKIKASLFTETENRKADGSFKSLDSCQEEYKKLQERIKTLEDQLASRASANNTV